jgi:hypothetical protein
VNAGRHTISFSKGDSLDLLRAGLAALGPASLTAGASPPWPAG